MKIIEIRQTKQGEIAYVWDGRKIIKMFVEDHTRAARTPAPEYEEEEFLEEEEFVEAPPVRMPSVKLKPLRVPKNTPVRISDLPVDSEGLPDLPRGEAPKSIIPPGMRGLFIEHDQPGAAVERRKI